MSSTALTAKAWTYRTLKLMAWSTAITIFVTDNVVEISNVKGNSMAPTLSPDYSTTGRKDSVLWYKWNPTKNLQRGDLVLFRTPHRPDDCAVKRVIALEGDSITLDPRRRPKRTRDGADLPESRGWDSLRGKVEAVPEGHLWVEGDNWRDTKDSNTYGPISKSLVLGKAIALTYPWSQFWTMPWEGFKGRTKVVSREAVKARQREVEDLVEAIRHG